MVLVLEVARPKNMRRFFFFFFLKNLRAALYCALCYSITLDFPTKSGRSGGVGVGVA
jgi:hypothetical protein